ncbi:MAG: M48 family metallopeptidase [Candidatus Brocadiia bacterium]
MFELIRANKLKSWLLIATLSAILVVLGYILGRALVPGGGLAGVMVAAVVALFLSGGAFLAGDRAVLAMSGARRIEKKDSPQLFNVVEEMSIAAGLPMPKVYIIDDTALNAFATGRKPENASVAITKGLLMKLNRDELQGVVAHEMSHIRNRDILFMTLAGILVGSVALLSDAFVRGLWYSGGTRRRRRSSRQGGGILVVLAIVAAVLAPIVATLLYLACSRRREYLADASAAQLTRYPEGLARALEKLSSDREVLEAANRATAPMYIVNPVKSLQQKAHALTSTHPPIDERVAILRSIGTSASMADYQRAWQRYHGGKQLASEAGIQEASQPAPVRQPAEKPTSEQSSQERLARAHEALDMVRRLGGFLFLTCSCGANLKVPPSYSRPQVRCPRCGAGHSVPRDQGEGADASRKEQAQSA